MKAGLTVLIATRGRPKQFLRAVNSAIATSPKAEVLAYVDHDDPEVKSYHGLSIERLRIIFGPRVGSAKALKELLKVCESEWMMLGADDIVFETPKWDERLIEALPKDGIGIAFPSDDNEDQCNHFLFHRKLYDLTGLWPDVFWHFGPDGYVGKVIEAVSPDRRVFVKDVLVRHLKAKSGKSPMDATFFEERMKGDGRKDMEVAMRRFDTDVSILKAEVERCASTG